MHAVHLIAVVAAAAAFGVAVGRRRGADSLRPLAMLVSAAVLAGNAVCLLPGSPGWYSAAVLVFSLAGLLWLVTAALGGQEEPAPVQGVITRLPPQRGTWASAGAPAAPSAGRVATVHSIIREQHVEVVTQETFDEAGPTGGRAAAGQGTYVAAHLGDYASEPRTVSHRPQGAVVRAHRVSPPTPEQRVQRLRARRAYAAIEGPTGRLTDGRS